MKKTVVIGVGNPARSDDGIGNRAIAELKGCNLPCDISLADIGMDDIAVIDYLKTFDKVVIVDAISAGKSPGTVYNFTSEEIKALPVSHRTEFHTFGLAQTLELARRLGAKADVKVIGMEPKSLEFAVGLSEEVQKNLPRLIKEVLSEVGDRDDV